MGHLHIVTALLYVQTFRDIHYWISWFCVSSMDSLLLLLLLLLPLIVYVLVYIWVWLIWTSPNVLSKFKGIKTKEMREIKSAVENWIILSLHSEINFFCFELWWRFCKTKIMYQIVFFYKWILHVIIIQ